ncbi:unnamed protein product [Vitrella brassicaformis CCMP3155]|uniref:Uncharacterized protein n=1 Tax=Vitrella brassicaformis (strain CCMP3155) TaxID=1169540 RepID=A0A0G4FBC8_VITBC|nr:unnamed protein product [Vitrella brassicaformis CCMP3155]|eukprot:CEM10184.1 unnamed protein product [Vitrella brassicaformis CCMP3155]
MVQSSMREKAYRRASSALGRTASEDPCEGSSSCDIHHHHHHHHHHHEAAAIQKCTRGDLEQINGWLIDLDGTMYVPGHLIEGAQSFHTWLIQKKKGYVYLSNTPAKGGAGVIAKFKSDAYRLNPPPGESNLMSILRIPEGAHIWAVIHSESFGKTKDNCVRQINQYVPKEKLDTLYIRTHISLDELNWWSLGAKMYPDLFYLFLCTSFPNDIGEDPVDPNRGYQGLSTNLLNDMHSASPPADPQPHPRHVDSSPPAAPSPPPHNRPCPCSPAPHDRHLLGRHSSTDTPTRYHNAWAISPDTHDSFDLQRRELARYPYGRHVIGLFGLATDSTSTREARELFATNYPFVRLDVTAAGLRWRGRFIHHALDTTKPWVNRRNNTLMRVLGKEWCDAPGKSKDSVEIDLGPLIKADTVKSWTNAERAPFCTASRMTASARISRSRWRCAAHGVAPVTGVPQSRVATAVICLGRRDVASGSSLGSWKTCRSAKLIVANCDTLDTHETQKAFPTVIQHLYSTGALEAFLQKSTYPNSHGRVFNVGKGGNIGDRFIMAAGHELLQKQMGEMGLDLTLKKENLAMIGDNLSTDIAAGASYNIKKILVLSGVHQVEHIKHFPDAPDCWLNSVKEIPEILA